MKAVRLRADSRLSEIRIAITTAEGLKGVFPSSLNLMPKLLITLTVLFVTLSAVFGVLNTNKARSLREIAASSESARATAEHARVTKEKELRDREVQSTAKYADTESKVASAEADLVKFQSERTDLHAQLQANRQQIAGLQRRLEDSSGMPGKDLIPDALPMPGGGDLQAQLEDTRRQLDGAERETQLFSGKTRGAQDQRSGVEAPRKRVANPTRANLINPKLRGTVLAVNQAYNFVVLNLGGRQGVEANSEMLVLRGGTLIGKIRISSVEPATAIADIMGSSLAPGVQVQPGDSVIYAGTNS